MKARFVLIAAVIAGAAILWLGNQSIGRIAELYNLLCADAAGYCDGIGRQVFLLRLITLVAAVAIPLAAFLLWEKWGAPRR